MNLTNVPRIQLPCNAYGPLRDSSLSMAAIYGTPKDPTAMQVFRWREIGDVPAEPGVYAWYYNPEITDFDLQQIVENVNALKAEGQELKATEAIRRFLHDNVFRYFTEQPYQTVMRGPLKPRYEGLLQHTPSLSDDLVRRLADDPRRLKTIKEVLEASAPNFASPIYIGMSEKLRTRLARHKILIEKYGNQPVTQQRPDEMTPEGDRRDQSFAREIRARNIPSARLFVVVHIIQGVKDEYVDIENILNRIHYPLLGRN